MPYLASAPLGTATVGFFVCHARYTSHTHTIAFRELVAMAASAAHDKESMTDGVALLRLAGAAVFNSLGRCLAQSSIRRLPYCCSLLAPALGKNFGPHLRRACRNSGSGSGQWYLIVRPLPILSKQFAMSDEHLVRFNA
jgi:hypothetical protein